MPYFIRFRRITSNCNRRVRVCLRACVRNLVLNPWAHSSWVILMILIKDLDILSRVNILWIRLMLIISKKLVIGSCRRRSRLNYSIILLAISYCLMIIWYKCILGIFGNQVGISCCSHGAIDILWPLLDIYKISVYCLRAIDLVLIIYRTLVVLKNLRMVNPLHLRQMVLLMSLGVLILLSI